MFRLNLPARSGLIIILAIASACFFPLLRAQSPELPPGPMQQKVTTACTECHESRIILQQRLSKAAWTKEVDKMIKWGAVVDSADRAGFIEYLSSNFPADKAPEVMPRAVSAKKQRRP
jgi:hypothetical protein